MANFIFIPAYGFRAAALATIASEVVLFAPFIVLARGKLDGCAGFEFAMAAAGGAGVAMLLVFFALGGPLLALIVGGAAYMAVLLLLRPLDAAEGGALLRLLPAGARGIWVVRWVAGG